jgi:hypothetical protein
MTRGGSSTASSCSGRDDPAATHLPQFPSSKADGTPVSLCLSFASTRPARTRPVPPLVDSRRRLTWSRGLGKLKEQAAGGRMSCPLMRQQGEKASAVPRRPAIPSDREKGGTSDAHLLARAAAADRRPSPRC